MSLLSLDDLRFNVGAPPTAVWLAPQPAHALPAYEGFFRTYDDLGQGFGITFSPDGTLMFGLSSSYRNIMRYTLGTAWDVTTAVLDAGQVFTPTTPQLYGPAELLVREDGALLLVIGTTNAYVAAFALATPFDLTSGDPVAASQFNVAAVTTSGKGFAFSPDGTRMFIVHSADGTVHSFTLATPWDLGTATADGVTYTFGLGNLNAIWASPDGTMLFGITANGDFVTRVDLATPWDLATAAVVSTAEFTEVSSPNTLIFKPDGKRVYVADSTNVHQYRLPSRPGG